MSLFVSFINQIGAGKTIPTIRNISETIMRKRESALLVRINWDDSDVPRDISDRRCPQNAVVPHVFSCSTEFFFHGMYFSVCIGQTGALQVRRII